MSKEYLKTHEKFCPDCKEVLPLVVFGTRLVKVGNRFLLYPRSFCNKCMSKRGTAWKKKNLERSRIYYRKYNKKRYSDIEKRAKILARQREGYKRRKNEKSRSFNNTRV